MALFESKQEGLNTELKEEPTSSSPDHSNIEHDVASEKKLVRKVDRRLLPILGALYSIALIDRVNVCGTRADEQSANAKLIAMTDISGSNLGHG